MIAAVVGGLAAGIGRVVAVCCFFTGSEMDGLADVGFSSLAVSLSILLAGGDCTDADWSSLVSISVVLALGSDSVRSSLMVI